MPNIVYKKVKYGGGSVGGSSELTFNLPVSMAVGGIKAGKTYTTGTSLEHIFTEMLNPVMNPTLTAPTALLTYNAPALVGVGINVAANTATISLNRGSINPQYNADEPYRSGAASGYFISMSGASSDYSDSNTTGIFNVPAFTRNTKGAVVITATVEYGAGTQPTNSIGEKYDMPLNPGRVSTSKTITFMLPYRYGVIKNKNDINMDDLLTDITPKGVKRYIFNTSNEYMVIAYDTAYGNLAQILDMNGFDVTSGFIKSVVGDYNVYVSSSPTTDIGAEYTFKY